MSEEKQPEKQEIIYPRVIFKVELMEDGKMNMVRSTSHLPTLDYIINTLLYETFEMRAQAKTEHEIKDAPKIKVSGIDQLRGFLRRKHAG